MFGDDERAYEVVRNAEEQYSIWPSGRPVPPGWEPAGMVGGKADCLAWIGDTWTDIRPRSVRDRSPR